VRKNIAAFVLGTALAGFPSSGPAAADQFDDQICPNVNDAGRRLNSLIDASKLLTDDLVAAAQAMVDGYRTCVRGYDDNTYNQPEAAGQQHTNGTTVGRVYARLALARALQRIGEYDADGKKFADAKSSFDEAIARIDEMKAIPSVEAMGGVGDSPEHRLIAKGDGLRKQIEASEAALPKVGP
jgi:hypothetical protein